MKLTVEKVTKGKSNNFVTKLSVMKVSTDDLGKSSKKTYYISLTKQLALNVEVEVDMAQYRIESYPYTLPTTGEEVLLKWLHLV